MAMGTIYTIGHAKHLNHNCVMIMADRNRFKSLANKTAEDEDDGKICIEQIGADALENVGAHEHLPKANTKNKAKRAAAKANFVDGASIGDIIAQVISAIQPVIVKLITVAVTSAVEAAATEQIMPNVRREMGVIEDVGKKLCSLQVENQKLTFEIDCLEQYSRRENVLIFGLEETQGENTNTVFIDMARDVGVTITPADISGSHRLGRPGGSSDH